MNEAQKKTEIDQQVKKQKTGLQVDKSLAKTEKMEEIKTLRNKLKKREGEIQHLKKEIESFKDKYIREIAERENLRKRVDREKSEFYQFAMSEFLKELLVVLDNFERALKSRNEDNQKSFLDGIEMIYKQYQTVLMKQGITPIEIKDKKFNPYLHQAFITEESEEVNEPTIGEELQMGYTLHGRLLRPCLVKVLVPKKKG